MADNGGTVNSVFDRFAVENGEHYARVLERLAAIEANTAKLGSIDDNLKQYFHPGVGSQGAARDQADANRANHVNNPFGQHHANNYGRNARAGKTFLDGFEKSLLEALGGREFREGLKKSLNKFAETLGVDVEDLGNEIGEQFGKMFSNSIKNSPIGRKFTDKLGGAVDKLFGSDGSGGVSGAINDILKEMKDNPDLDFSFFREKLEGIDLGKFGNLVKNGGLKLTQGLDKLTGGLGSSLILFLAFKKALSTATEGLQMVGSGFKDMIQSVKQAGDRYNNSRQKNIELANKRMQEDVKTLIETPFKILEKAAQEVYDAWNANIRLIGQTQGYTKADMQDLMSAYAQRLQQEGLANTIATTEVYNNLAKVLESGLSGNAAVEFAYQATKYGAAIPTQDFFSYVDTYSSIAANAIAAGKSEAEALTIANNSLADFSNSLLTASRNLTGGYSTGLKAADSLYASATRIAQAAKSENISGISNALLAVQGYVGSIAPDLATNLSDKIYQLALGGNSADIVALRSLAGINASNTEFLRSFSENPQAVLSSMFANLGRMYTQSPDAYMEKAEGYASLFGLSAEAFQRVDFMSLANAVSNMDSSTDTLKENLKLLRDGQTTTTQEQQKIAQINKYMIEEGLAYVIDNEAAQMIQQHMWDEQLAREMMEAEYGVNLVGGAALALEKILAGVDKVLSILNPIAWLSKISKVVETIAEDVQEQKDIASVLELGKVGTGNRIDFYNLTTRNQDLNLTRSLVDIMGGKGRYGTWTQGTVSKIVDGLGHPLQSISDILKWTVKGGLNQMSYAGQTSAAEGLPVSQYNWGSISKSSAAVALAALKTTSTAEVVSQEAVSQLSGVVSASVATLQGKVEKMMSDEYLYDRFVKQGKSYQQWLDSAKDMGIADMEAALAEAGYRSSDVEEYFESRQTEAGMVEKYNQAQEEHRFRTLGINFWETRFWDDFNMPMSSLVTRIANKIDEMFALQSEWKNQQLDKLNTISYQQLDWKNYFSTAWIEEAWKTDFVGESGLFSRFFDEFVKKFIDATYYNESGANYEAITDVQRRESAEKGSAVYALADALTGNMNTLKDPQMQTNALLAQILIVATAIMNQNNNVAGTTSLSDALSSLALGLTSTTPLDETPT